MSEDRIRAIPAGRQWCVRWKEAFHFDIIFNTLNEGFDKHDSLWMASVGLVIINYNFLLRPSWLTWLHTSPWLTGISVASNSTYDSPTHPSRPTSLLTPCCHNLSHSLYPCLCPCSCVWPLCPGFWLQDQKKNYKAVQSCEEGGSGGAYLEPLVALAQNGANMHNVLGPACIFLRKGFAESRQAVRKSRQHHAHACQVISTQYSMDNNRWMCVVVPSL